MEKFLFYRMTYDTGFAPNPLGEYLTLATCTPNHISKNLKIGDWIVGVESKKLARERIAAGCNPHVEQSLIFIAKVNEILDLNSYFNDPRFEYKKPKPHSKDYFKRSGDNVYYIENGMWKWIRGHDHDPCKQRRYGKQDEELFFKVEDLERLLKSKKMKEKYGEILKDIKGNKVFISKEFLYFGDKGIKFDKKFLKCIPYSRGIKYCPGKNCPERCFEEFKRYLNSLLKKFGYGKHGDPICYCIRYKLNRREFCK
ncbi:Nmad2 family putative nucleotide modification protein [Desulfurobacterium sp.]